jgi:hypothetical protein
MRFRARSRGHSAQRKRLKRNDEYRVSGVRKQRYSILDLGFWNAECENENWKDVIIGFTIFLNLRFNYTTI